MVRVHAASSQPHYWRHIRPIWEALPIEMRGEIFDGKHARIARIGRDDVFLIAGMADLHLCAERRVIYVEHGAGQTYSRIKDRWSAYYPGGHHSENVIGYICPNEVVAQSWAPRPSVVVGCPALDRIEGGLGSAVVFTFHWDAWQVAPEARSAREHYLEHLHMMKVWAEDTSPGVMSPLGHAHPRDKWAEGIWESIGVPFEPDPDVALRKASLVVADNTSFAYEAALLGIPNVALNAPWYRRDVHHGLRFWDHPPGLMVDDGYELISTSVEWWMGSVANAMARQAAAQRAYGAPHRGGGAKLASEFIIGLVG